MAIIKRNIDDAEVHYKAKMEAKDNKRLCMFICILVLNVFISNASFFLFGEKQASIAFILKMVCGLFFLNCLPIILRHITVAKLSFVFGSVITLALNFLLFQNNELFDTAFFFFTTCATGFLVVETIDNFSLLRRYLVNISRLVSLACILILILNFIGIVDASKSGEYFMGLGYSCITCTMLLVWNYVSHRKMIDLFGAIGTLILILLYCSRGPLVGIALFIFYFVIKYLHKKGKDILCVLLIICIVTFGFFLNDVMIFLYNIVSKLGIESRTLYLFVTHDINRDSGRDYLWEQLIIAIKEHPFIIRGINADYELIQTYAHNLVLEMLFQHGLIIGGIFLIFVLSNVTKTLLMDTNEDFTIICKIFMFSSVPSLMFSGSVWTSYIFWIWLGLTYNKNNDVVSYCYRVYRYRTRKCI